MCLLPSSGASTLPSVYRDRAPGGSPKITLPSFHLSRQTAKPMGQGPHRNLHLEHELPDQRKLPGTCGSILYSSLPCVLPWPLEPQAMNSNPSSASY